MKETFSAWFILKIPSVVMTVKERCGQDMKDLISSNLKVEVFVVVRFHMAQILT